jgi:hypothetical protein
MLQLVQSSAARPAGISPAACPSSSKRQSPRNSSGVEDGVLKAASRPWLFVGQPILAAAGFQPSCPALTNFSGFPSRYLYDTKLRTPVLRVREPPERRLQERLPALVPGTPACRRVSPARPTHAPQALARVSVTDSTIRKPLVADLTCDFTSILCSGLVGYALLASSLSGRAELAPAFLPLLVW